MPLSILGGKSRKTAFSKMATIGSGRTFFICGAILINKRSILTNSGDSISDIYFNHNHILEHEF